MLTVFRCYDSDVQILSVMKNFRSKPTDFVKLRKVNKQYVYFLTRIAAFSFSQVDSDGTRTLTHDAISIFDLSTMKAAKPINDEVIAAEVSRGLANDCSEFDGF